MRSPIFHTTFVSTYPPRRCGIATFTHDLAAASGGGEIAVVSDAAPVNAVGELVAARG